MANKAFEIGEPFGGRCGGRRQRGIHGIALFAPNGVVADPVGPSMFDPEGNGHVGPEGIGVFYDAAIAGDQVHFEFPRALSLW